MVPNLTIFSKQVLLTIRPQCMVHVNDTDDQIICERIFTHKLRTVWILSNIFYLKCMNI